MIVLNENTWAIHDKDDHWLCDIHFSSFNRSPNQAANKKEALAQARNNGYSTAYKAYHVTK